MADCIMLYNKPSFQELIDHFTTIAEIWNIMSKFWIKEWKELWVCSVVMSTWQMASYILTNISDNHTVAIIYTLTDFS